MICNNEINEVSKSEKNCSIKIEVELSRWRPENSEGKDSPKIFRKLDTNKNEMFGSFLGTGAIKLAQNKMGGEILSYPRPKNIQPQIDKIVRKSLTIPRELVYR